jgi:aryl-alcohol dehydrogenase-like predicted oxidoreductase
VLARKLGHSGIEVSALGIGCWAIGGPIYREGKQSGWGEIDDDESIRAIHRALEMGITFLDTADIYGAGHSERVLAKALEGKRDQVVIATKFGNKFNEETRRAAGRDASPGYVREACDASLTRLGTDHIDLYQLHIGDYDTSKADEVMGALEELVDEGKIRSYGWSTDDPLRASAFVEGPHYTAVQQRLNILEGNEETLEVCERHNLASLNRGPLGMGLLTGKFDRNSSLPETDVRGGWNFREGDVAERLEKLRNIRDVLTSDGRTPAQGALSWLWARSEKTVPIPGFKTVEQIEENVGALGFGPLDAQQMRQLDELLSANVAKS